MPSPTGQVNNPGTGFVLSNGTTSAPANFMFATETGQIAAWSRLVDPPMGAAEIKVTTPGVGYVPGYCDPWWYVCYPGGFVPVENIVGDRSSTDFGMDFGGGVKFGPAYAEARYHYIWGPTVEEQVTTLPSTTATSTTERKANGQFFMLTFGIRF